ncbi:MAG: RNA polymerase sigma factor [Planctomycetes bacterium]|nr:RNA polymerase sigma factor [Planctomycetota bacterium]
MSERGREQEATAEFRRAVGGDAASFAAFLARFEGRIARIVRSLVPASDAEDVFQEICLRLLAKGHTFDPARPLEPWLDAVTRQVCAADARKRKRLSRAGGADALDDVAAREPSDADPWVRDVVRDVIAGARGEEREAMRLVLAHGLTQREAAKRLGVPPGTVASWLAKAVRAVRARLRGTRSGE